MPSFDVARIREQGQDMLLFALDDRFGGRSDAERNAFLNELEQRAHAAGLAGRAVVLWRHGGHEHFMGPPQWQPFLRGLSLNDVVRSANRTISW